METTPDTEATLANFNDRSEAAPSGLIAPSHFLDLRKGAQRDVRSGICRSPFRRHDSPDAGGAPRHPSGAIKRSNLSLIPQRKSTSKPQSFLMEFHTLSRTDLQALCKRNCILAPSPMLSMLSTSSIGSMRSNKISSSNPRRRRMLGRQSCRVPAIGHLPGEPQWRL